MTDIVYVTIVCKNNFNELRLLVGLFKKKYDLALILLLLLFLFYRQHILCCDCKIFGKRLK